MKVTIIIPSYNRHPLNLLTLNSLERQNFNHSDMEVVFIDDGSTDETPSLQEYNPPYQFKYIRNNQNLGRAITRNLGIMHAKGSVLIFLDAEVIVDQDFVTKHYYQHKQEDNLVCVGFDYNKIYTCLSPMFNKEQVNEVCFLQKNSESFKNTLMQNVEAEKISFMNRLKVININEPVQLLFKEDIYSFSPVKAFSIPMKYQNFLYEPIKEGVLYPWWACISMNFSVKKSMVEAVGGFDESFEGWGLEDYEIAYRFYKAGAKFEVDKTISVYHQEHPTSMRKEEEEAKNLVKFQQKHPFMEIYILSIRYIGMFSHIELYKSVAQEFESLPNDKYHLFKKAIVSMLKRIAYQKSQGQPIQNLLKTSVIDISKEDKKRLFSENKELRKSGYRNLVTLFKKLQRI